MKDIKSWYAVYTRPRWEKKVAALLEKNNIFNYCPLNREVKQWSDRKKVVYEPLFRSYVFVQVTEKEHTVVRQTDGIVNFVCWLGKPAVIRDEEIDLIRHFLNEHTSVQVKKMQVDINDVVRIVRGPLMENERNVVLVKGNSVKVVLPSLGFVMQAEVKTADIQIISKNPQLLPGTFG
jgi:transcription antitermination factor NusG